MSLMINLEPVHEGRTDVIVEVLLSQAGISLITARVYRDVIGVVRNRRVTGALASVRFSGSSEVKCVVHAP